MCGPALLLTQNWTLSRKKMFVSAPYQHNRTTSCSVRRKKMEEGINAKVTFGVGVWQPISCDFCDGCNQTFQDSHPPSGWRLHTDTDVMSGGKERRRVCEWLSNPQCLQSSGVKCVYQGLLTLLVVNLWSGGRSYSWQEVTSLVCWYSLFWKWERANISQLHKPWALLHSKQSSFFKSGLYFWSIKLPKCSWAELQI